MRSEWRALSTTPLPGEGIDHFSPVTRKESEVGSRNCPHRTASNGVVTFIQGPGSALNIEHPLSRLFCMSCMELYAALRWFLVTRWPITAVDVRRTSATSQWHSRLCIRAAGMGRVDPVEIRKLPFGEISWPMFGSRSIAEVVGSNLQRLL